VVEYGFVKEYWKQFAEQKQVVLRTIETLKDFTTCYREQLDTKPRKGHNIARKNTAINEFKKWFARAYVNGAYGLPKKSDESYLSYRELDSFLEKRSFRSTLNALSNNRKKDADIPNVVPKTDFLVGLVDELKKQFPSFDTSKVFYADS